MRRIASSLLLMTLLVTVALGPSGCVALGITPTPEPVVLKFAVAEDVMPIQRLVDEFHAQYPWITVQFYQTSALGGNSVQQWVRSGDVDVFRTSREAMAWIDDDLLKPIDDMHLDDFQEIRDDYYGGLWESLSQEGVQFGVPAGIDVYVAFVNTDQAESLGVALPAEDWELFDFIEVATAMNLWDPGQMSDNALFGFGTDPEGMDPLVFVYMRGGAIVDDIENPRQALLDDPLTIEATQTYADLFTRYQLSPTPQVAGRIFPRGGIYEAQVRGRCGVWFNWFSQRGGGTGMLEWQSGWKMYNLPRDRADMAMGNVEGYYLSAKTAHPEEALIWIRFLADRWDAAGNMLPPRLSHQQNDSYRQTLGEELTAVVDAFPRNIIFLPGGFTPELEAIGGAYYSALGKVIAQDADAYNELQEAQMRVSTILE